MSDLVGRHDVQMSVVGAENQVAVDCRAFHDHDIFILITVAICVQRDLQQQQQQQHAIAHNYIRFDIISQSFLTVAK